VAFYAVGGQHRLDGVRRKSLAQFGAYDPVAVARPGQARMNVMPCDEHESGGVFSQDGFGPVAANSLMIE
jgi:hypothetical protein